MIRLQVVAAIVLGLATLAYFRLVRDYQVGLAVLVGISVGALAYTGLATLGRLARLWKPGRPRYEIVREPEDDPSSEPRG